MKWTSNPRTFATLLGLLIAVFFSRTPPETRVTLYPPKQPHHVIYVTMCGVLEGIIITTNPVQYADYKTPMTKEMFELEFEALVAGRAFSFAAGLWVMCGKPEPEDLKVIQ